LFQTYKGRAEFFLVYIREAHPDSVLTVLKDGKPEQAKIAQTNTVAERAEAAKQCTAVLKLSLPTLIDGADNRVNRAYAAWPDRLYVIGVDGRIAYQGGPGPGGFRPAEVEAWLKQLK
jgi:hypothetical protein